MTSPLNGVRVLDLSRGLAGPFCTQILADFGAEVIKVENTAGGDPERSQPPLIGEQGTNFYSVNRNKKSITVDLKKEEGRTLFKKLAARVDIVLDQFRPGVMERMGLGYEVLKEINQRLIYCTLTGFGTDGPMKDTAAHDINLLSWSGLAELTGTADGPPSISAAQVAGLCGGSLHAVIAIMMALYNRERTGQGQMCEVAMLDGTIALLGHALGTWSGRGQVPERGQDILTGGYACYNFYPAKDGYISLGAWENKFWSEFCAKIGCPEFADKQWDDSWQRAMKEAIGKVTREKTRAEWIAIFPDICMSPVLNLEEMSKLPQVRARNMLLELDNFKDSGRELRLAGLPIRLSETPAQAVLTFPILGEHNAEVLRELGYADDMIDRLRDDKVIG
ncbi:MAG: CaiB/BaiF CoA transferase family protein [Candidatus Saccharibacteria bacterium]